MTKSLVSSRLPNQRQTQPAGGKGTSHQSTSTIQAHTLTTRMHFNFPPCCVHTENGQLGEGGVPATSSNCCKSAKPQMLSVTQKSTLSQQQQPRQNHQTNPPQSVPLPFPFPFSSPRGAARTRCRRQSSSICLPSIMAAHCGITELPDASCTEGVLPTADFGQLLIKRVENPLCYGI